MEILDNDIIVVAQKVISKAEGRLVDLNNIVPSQKANKISKIHDKDPRLIELILQESLEVLKISKQHLIVETKHGFICANAGIDKSNVSMEDSLVLLLPENPDLSAAKLRKNFYDLLQKNVAIIISDTFGRPFRNGQTNIAIGIAGINAIKSYIGETDDFGKILKVTEIAIVDELAGAAELVMGKVSRVPAAIIRGYNSERTDFNSNYDDLFSVPSHLSVSKTRSSSLSSYSSPASSTASYPILSPDPNLKSIKRLLREKSKDLFRK